ncbi:MAG TPA: OmpA family protein [Bacteroidales bacterium]|nr:OmpA family protein [Bacteroidales bacterium]
MKLILKVPLLVCFLFASILAWGQEVDSENQYESLDMSVIFDRTYRMTIPAMYKNPDVVMLPVGELFDFLKVPNKVSPDGQVIKGFFEDETKSFEINNLKKFVQFKDKTYPISSEEATSDVGILYLSTTVFKRAFGFDMVFNNRSLSIQFTSPFELPLFKFMKQEKQRENLRITGGENAVYDTIMKRDYHWFKGEMLDWSVASTQSNDGITDSRVEIGGGAELLGGETNVWLNYSTIYGMKRNQQQYYWRWADNSAKIIRQVQIGRIATPSISSVLSPVDGFMVTNALTTLRKALGNYTISDHTDPDWVVELYLNNQLISYTRADASGFYSFKVPIVYGSSNIVLRFYGPSGEIRSEQKTYNMPFNLLPKGEFEYKVSGGILLDSISARFAKAEFNYGLSRTLTLGGGVEYLTSIANRPEVPFLNFTFQPFSNLLMIGEYAHQVRSRISMNYSFPKNIILDLSYSKYVPGQEAIIYNYLEERSASLSIPMRFRNITSSLRSSFRQNVYDSFSYSSAEVMWSNNYKNYSMIFTNFANISAANSMNLYGNLTLATKLRNDLNIRSTAQYNYIFKQLISLRLEFDRKLFANGHGSLKLENNFLTNNQSVSFTFRYDLPYMSTNASVSASNSRYQMSEGASGSFAFNSGDNYVITDRRNAVGRSGISIIPFIDMNFNGIKDKKEPYTKGLKIRSTGGQIMQRDQDSIIRIVGLEPFTDYILTLDESGFDNVSLRLNTKSMKVTTDPNQFKIIMLPVQPMAEISGMVADESGKGIGRIIVRITDKKDNVIAKVLTESDGYFNFIGFKPGDYKVFVDSMQMDILKFNASPIFVSVLENPDGDVVDAGTIELVKKPTLTEPILESIPGVLESNTVMQDSFQVDTLEFFTLLFDVNNATVKKSYLDSLKKLAINLNKPSNLQIGIDVQGHTDSDGNEWYNLYLSNKRALAVKRILIKDGVDANRIKTSAFGESKLVNANKTAKEKALNRRVKLKKILVTEKAERPLEDVIRDAPEQTSRPTQKSGAQLVSPISKINPNPVAKKASVSIANQTVVPFLKSPVVNVDFSAAVRCENVPSWCLMYKSGNSYWFQVAAFKSLTHAVQYANRLKGQFKGGIYLVTIAPWVKVQVGYYKSQADALHDAEMLYSKGFIKKG